tara:strand:- start:13536 stop:14882 length:1347 start_codon:yes stop_codon:yes gene_type:complete
MATWKKIITESDVGTTVNGQIGTDIDIDCGANEHINQINLTDGVVTSISKQTMTASDIGAAASSHSHNYLPNQDVGTGDGELVEVDSSTVGSGEYARFTGNGLESRTAAEVASDIQSNITDTGTITTTTTISNSGSGTLTLQNDSNSTSIEALKIMSQGQERASIVSNGSVHCNNLEVNGNIISDLTIKAGSGATDLTITGNEGSHANLYLYADDGDDAADKYKIQANTGGYLAFQRYTGSAWDTAIRITSNGETSISGLVYPTSDGSADQVLKTNGSGTLSWTNQSGGGGSVTASQTLVFDCEGTSQSVNSSNGVFQWGTPDTENGTYITHSNGGANVTLESAGEYMVYAYVLFNNSSSNDRTNFSGYIYTEDSGRNQVMNVPMSGTYIRDDHNSYDSGMIGGSGRIFASADDVLMIKWLRHDVQNAGTINMVTASSRLQIYRITYS